MTLSEVGDTACESEKHPCRAYSTVFLSLTITPNERQRQLRGTRKSIQREQGASLAPDWSSETKVRRPDARGNDRGERAMAVERMLERGQQPASQPAVRASPTRTDDHNYALLRPCKKASSRPFSRLCPHHTFLAPPRSCSLATAALHARRRLHFGRRKGCMHCTGPDRCLISYSTQAPLRREAGLSLSFSLARTTVILCAVPSRNDDSRWVASSLPAKVS